MFASKTTRLIERLRNAQHAGRRVGAFKPSIDNRYAEKAIVSHDGARFPAARFGTAKLFEVLTLSPLPRWDVVGVDEVQFAPADIFPMLLQLRQNGVRVICAGLARDFRDRPFGITPTLLDAADHVTQCYAVCACCGGQATRSYRKIDAGDTVVVGGAEAYEPRCEPCARASEATTDAALDRLESRVVVGRPAQPPRVRVPYKGIEADDPLFDTRVRMRRFNGRLLR